MNTWFGMSYAVLWLVMFAILVLNLLLFRQLGIIVMGTARGVDRSGIPAGRRLPSVEVRTLDGSQWTPGQEERPYLLFIGATYCEECSALMPALRELQEIHNVRVVNMLFAEDEDEARDYGNKVGMLGPAMVIGQDIGHELDAGSVPFAYAVGGDGVIRAKGLANSEARLVQLLKESEGREIRLHSMLQMVEV